MDFPDKAVHQVKTGINEDVFTNPYKHCISFYTVPPIGKTTLDEAEAMISERLNLLQICDEMLKSLEKSSTFRRNKQYFETIDSRLQNSESKFDKSFYSACKGSDKKPEVMNARKRDQISHFLLMIYYCRSDELRKWFISRECELLRARLMDNSITPDLPQILEFNGFNYEKVETTEMDKFKAEILWNNSSLKSASYELTVYKIPFEESLDAVRNRKVFLSNGFAYIIAQDMISVICSKFRSNLSHSLAVFQRHLHELEEERRLIPQIHALHMYYIENRKSAVKSEDDCGREVVTPEVIDTLAKESFPPCMRNTNDILRKDHHLKHYGRLHYGLFLKAIGLSLDDALKFFREEFIKKITPERFQKDYAYNIRYNYGKEGKRVSGMAFSCQKIINDNPPGPADTHGCPFKHFDRNNLKQMLKRHSIDENKSQMILEVVEKEQNYSKACSLYFNTKHSWYPEVVVYHPNMYFTESRKALTITQLTPPDSGQTLMNSDISLIADTTTDTMNESLFENEDDFDRTVDSMVWESCAPNPSKDTEPVEGIVSTDNEVPDTDVVSTVEAMVNGVVTTADAVSTDEVMTTPEVNFNCEDIPTSDPILSTNE